MLRRTAGCWLAGDCDAAGDWAIIKGAARDRATTAIPARIRRCEIGNLGIQDSLAFLGQVVAESYRLGCTKPGGLGILRNGKWDFFEDEEGHGASQRLCTMAEPLGKRAGGSKWWWWLWRPRPCKPSPAQAKRGPSLSPANSQPAPDVPDAPSTVQPPPPKPPLPAALPPDAGRGAIPIPFPGDPPPQPVQDRAGSASHASRWTRLPRAACRETKSTPRRSVQIGGARGFVPIPVTVSIPTGAPSKVCWPRTFSVLENGKPQTLTYFTSDPFELSVAIVLDIGMPDVEVQKMNQTYSSLVGAAISEMLMCMSFHRYVLLDA